MNRIQIKAVNHVSDTLRNMSLDEMYTEIAELMGKLGVSTTNKKDILATLNSVINRKKEVINECEDWLNSIMEDVEQ